MRHKAFSNRQHAKILSQLHQDAINYGFAPPHITSACLPSNHKEHMRAYLSKQYHGAMQWMADTFARRSNPKQLWQDARTVIVLPMNYGPNNDPLQQLKRKHQGNISVYARNRDYHDIIKGRLKIIASRLASRACADVKVFVDTAPLMEKPLAAQAGVGWQGKHTNLVSRAYGSWLFLGTILTDLELPTDSPEADHCGTCRACLDICPTQAFPAPYQLDARRCISYLTIEHKGPIPHNFRKAMGNRIYGCDDCLAVCPWNKFAKEAQETKLQARADLQRPPLDKLASLDDAAFRKKFSGSPIKRIGRNRFLRNVLMAIGNSESQKMIPSALNNLDDASPLVRGSAVWAIGQLLAPKELKKLHDKAKQETDPSVRAEWAHIFKPDRDQPNP